jgi:hypothetical protein
MALGIYGLRNEFLTATRMKENDIAAISAPVICALLSTHVIGRALANSPSWFAAARPAAVR